MQSLLVKALQHRPQLIKCALNDHFAFRAAVPVVFFYRKSIPADLIINSLQHVLNDFPLFAGIIVKHDHQLYIDCNNQGVQVRIKHSDKSLFAVLSDFQELDDKTFVDMVKPAKSIRQRRPLLTIKLNYYPDGMAIGYCWHHSLGDMSTFMEFLKALSAHAQGKYYQPGFIVPDREDYLKKWIEKEIKLPTITRPSGLKFLNLRDIYHFIKHILSPKHGLYIYFNDEEIATLRNTLSNKAGERLSRNDVVCAHLLNILSECREDNADEQRASVIVNIRPRIGMPSNILGNYLGAASIKFPKTISLLALARHINLSVKNFLFENFRYKETQEFLQEFGGMKKLDRIIPEEFLPENKNLIISSWTNFGVYNIDFGIIAPYLFLPIGQAPFPWVSCIVEGFDNKGLLVAIVLPIKVGKRLRQKDMIDKMHLYRSKTNEEILLPKDVL